MHPTYPRRTSAANATVRRVTASISATPGSELSPAAQNFIVDIVKFVHFQQSGTQLPTSSLFTGVINYVGTLKASDQVPATPCHPGLRIRHRFYSLSFLIHKVVVLSSGGVL
ncbi:uncharacterized protein PGTG_04673 [Puccinia graminis f. sp. tritici CRL 75-36-700-3]|uniref:Uncharacterized protein n=1 Tax=Puccinia graminis f. sp. tritici (strain CRL 75-36-700-3 / race SCCL) TaxID=418459 RepID=E3K3R5_PUCGT|nr:uncharacterized protein PGTG_04673 [Puccinia graminis f. sp. tritici CRL 75-36-700-3]EFP78717.2 hypothetical protein PGTG_04673 [Puccinia graminis f. sp. tritici CRL 75-36-700-3]